MNSAASFAIVVLAAVVTIDTARAQQPVTDNVAIDSLIAKLQGAWRPSDVNINGQPSRTSTYGDSRFAGNTWTLQTTNGDHVYELSAINAKADPIEITFTEKDPKRSFIGLLSLDGDTLTITRGMQFTKGKDGIAQIPRPESLDPGRDRIVYTWKRVADSPDISKRPTLTVRLFDDGAVKKEIANHTIRSLFGGKLEYSAGADAAKKLATTSTALGRRVENPILVGTQITGSIEALMMVRNVSRLRSASVMLYQRTNPILRLFDLKRLYFRPCLSLARRSELTAVATAGASSSWNKTL